ncbi:MAG: sensor domain-containing protein [Candidatus Thorarchaeota archaeon]
MLLMPIGIILFTYVVTCFSTFVGLIPIVVGLPLLYFFLISLPYLTKGFAWLGTLLVGVEIPLKNPVVQEDIAEESFWKKTLQKLKKRSILYSFLYFIFVAMPIGIVTFTLVVSLIPTALGLLFSWVALIVEYAITGGVLSNGWMITTGLPNAFWIFVYCVTPFVGFFLLTASLHLFNKLAVVHARIIAKMV